MDKVVAYLLEKETITGAEMVAIIEGRDPAEVDAPHLAAPARQTPPAQESAPVQEPTPTEPSDRMSEDGHDDET